MLHRLSPGTTRCSLASGAGAGVDGWLEGGGVFARGRTPAGVGTYPGGRGVVVADAPGAGAASAGARVVLGAAPVVVVGAAVVGGAVVGAGARVVDGGVPVVVVGARVVVVVVGAAVVVAAVVVGAARVVVVAALVVVVDAAVVVVVSPGPAGAGR